MRDSQQHLLSFNGSGDAEEVSSYKARSFSDGNEVEPLALNLFSSVFLPESRWKRCNSDILRESLSLASPEDALMYMVL